MAGGSVGALRRLLLPPVFLPSPPRRRPNQSCFSVNESSAFGCFPRLFRWRFIDPRARKQRSRFALFPILHRCDQWSKAAKRVYHSRPPSTAGTPRPLWLSRQNLPALLLAHVSINRQDKKRQCSDSISAADQPITPQRYTVSIVRACDRVK